MIYFLGQNISAGQAKYRSTDRAKKPIQRIAKGIYVDVGDDVNALVQEHSTRIASHLFPKSYFSNISAYTGGVPDNGVVFMKGPQHKIIELDGLTIHHARDYKEVSELDSFSFQDEFGESSFRKSGLMQLLLEGVEKIKKFPNSLNDYEIQEIFDFYISEYEETSQDKAIAALVNFAKENDMEHLYDRLVTKIDTAQKERTSEVQAEFDLNWHNKSFGKINYDGYAWRYKTVDGWLLPMSIAGTKGKSLPAFIESILPEVVIGKKSDHDVAIDLLKQGKRYLSNISIFDAEDTSERVVLDDIILTSSIDLDDGLGGYKEEGVINWDSLPEPDEMYEINVGIMNGDEDTPRLSGMQLKTPVSVSGETGISSATHLPFTHLMKLPGRDTTAELPFREWLGMQACTAGGAEVANNLLVDLQTNGFAGPGMICERFDIRKGEDDKDFIMAEDFSAVLNITSDMKYKKTLEDVGTALKKVSTAPKEDMKEFMRMVATGWLIGNGDLHTKNVCVIKRTENPETGWDSIRLAPAFDAVHTNGILNNGRILDGNFSMPMNGKRTGLEMSDFIEFGSNIGVSKRDTEEIVNRAASGIKAHCMNLAGNLPDFVLTDSKLTEVAAEFSKATMERCDETVKVKAKPASRRFYKG